MKTRLSPPLTPEEAAALSVAMAEDLMERLTVFGKPAATGRAAAEPPDLQLRYTGEPPGRSPAHDRSSRHPASDTRARGLTVPAGWSAAPQGGGNLGDRLLRAAAAATSDSVERLVIVGADAPLLPLDLVEEAFAALRNHPVALAPAADGGYVLLGLATGRLPPTSVASLLREVPWGTAEVLETTHRNAAAARLEVAILPSSWDVDHPEDLIRLRREIAALPAPDRPHRVDAFLSRTAT